MDEKFDNPRQVHQYLVGMGIRVALRTVYNHVKARHLIKENDGYFGLAAVQKYVATWLTDKQPPVLDAGADQIASIKRGLLTEQRRKIKLANDITVGKYVLKETSDREKAQLLTVMKSDLENMMRVMAAGQAEKIRGDQQYLADLIDYNLQCLAAHYGRWAENVKLGG